MDNVENGIIELIALHNIKWLVMGAASDACSSRYKACITDVHLVAHCHPASVFEYSMYKGPGTVILMICIFRLVRILQIYFSCNSNFMVVCTSRLVIQLHST